MEFHSDRFFFVGQKGKTSPEFVQSMPRFDKNGKPITNPFTYMILLVLERILREISAKEFNPYTGAQIWVRVVCDEHDYYRIEAELDTDVD